MFNTIKQTINKSILIISRQCHHHGHKVLVSGNNIYYEKHGTGHHHVLLLPGALGSTKTDFPDQIQGLNRDKFTLIAWDPPGYGQSRPPERDFDNFYRKDVFHVGKLMEQIGIDKYSVLGWSDGGITGMILAAQRPQNVKKLVIWGSNAYINDEDRRLILSVRDTNKWSQKARQGYEDVYGKEYFEQFWHRFVDEYVKINDICKDDLANIQCPTFILNGDLDPMVSKEHFDYLAQRIKNVRLHRFPQGRHNIHLRYAQEFNKLVEGFLNE